MEQSATKRRKLSPPTVAASPLRVDGEPTSRDGAHSSAHRASYRSPTKASLARFNPGLLPPVRSIGTRRETAGKSPSVRTRKSEGDALNGDALNGAAGISTRTHTEPLIGEADGGRDGAEAASAPRRGLAAASRGRSQTPTVQHTASRHAQTQPAPDLRHHTYKTANTAPPLGKSRPGSDTGVATQGNRPPNGVIIDAYTMDKLPHTPTRHGLPPGAARIDNAGPSLPSTPSQFGLEAPPGRPKGLLFGKPHDGTKERGEGPSASKSKKAVAKQPSVERSTTSTLGSKIYLRGLPRPAPTIQQIDLHKKITSRRQSEEEILSLGSSHLEDVLLSSWKNPRAKETAGQQRQRKKLTELSRKLLRLREDIDHLQSSIDGNDNTLVGERVQSDGATSSESLTLSSLSLPQRLSQFFPFSHNERAARLGAAPDPATLHLGQTVKIKSSELLNEGTDDPEALLQRHDAEFLSDGLLITALGITINSTTLEIHDLKMLEQDPDPPQEMQTWTLAGGHSRALTSIGTAVTSCSCVVERRAACWRSCYERHADLLEPLLDANAIHGRQTITFEREGLSLSITWQIRLREEGEAESKLSIALDLPPVWVNEGIVSGSEGADVREAFDLLVKERGVTEAITAMVKLLFSAG